MEPLLTGPLAARFGGPQRVLGAGSFGRVLRVHDQRLGHPVALKLITAQRPDLVRELSLEIEAACQLDHPCIIRVLDGDPRGAPPWLAMECAEAGTLGDFADAGADWATLVPLIDGLLAGLGHAHARGLIHRDIKPDNVLLAQGADGRTLPRIADFGLAKLRLQRGGFRSTRLAAGSLGYMAPEQFEDASAGIHPGTDLYAVGVLIWRLVTGVLPWRDRPAAALLLAKSEGDWDRFTPRIEVPPGLQFVLTRLLAPVPADRYALAADVRADLAALCGGPEVAPIAPVAGRPGRAPRLAALRPPPLVGRVHLRERLRAAADTPPDSPLSLAGPEGSGRRRLAAWLSQTLEEEGAARAIQLDLDDPIGLSRALRGWLHLGRLYGARLQTRLRGWCAAHQLPDEWVEELRWILDPPAEVDEDALHAAAAAACATLLAAEGRPRTLIRLRGQAPARLRVLQDALVEGGRPALMLREDSTGGAHGSLAVPPLSTDELRALIAALAPGHPPSEQDLARLEGLPGLAVECARWLVGQPLQPARSPTLTLRLDTCAEEEVGLAALARARLEAFVEERGSSALRLLGTLARGELPDEALETVLLIDEARALGLLTRDPEPTFASRRLLDAALRLAGSAERTDPAAVDAVSGLRALAEDGAWEELEDRLEELAERSGSGEEALGLAELARQAAAGGHPVLSLDLRRQALVWAEAAGWSPLAAELRAGLRR